MTTTTMDRYEYTGISENLKQFAICELNENPLQVNAHIESFRRWVKSMPHLSCPTDAAFLIRFLRVAKFDHKKAEKRLDNFCTTRSSTRGSPEFFQFFQIDDPLLDFFLNLNMQFPLGRTEAGEVVLLIRAKAWDAEKVPFSKLIVFIFMIMDAIASEEETQIRGFQMLLDLGDVTKKSMEAWGDPKIAKKWNSILQDSYPVRLKGQIYYNEPLIFDIVFQVASFFMNEKTRSRTVRVKNDIKKAMEKIPGLESILPTEYQGKGGSIAEISDRWKIKFRNYYQNGNVLQSIAVDESKRPPEAASYLVEYADYKGVTLGKEGTYTKYENIF